MKNLLTLLVGVTVQIQGKMKDLFLNTPSRCHYTFSMKDLTVVFRYFILPSMSCLLHTLCLPDQSYQL